MKSFFDKIKLDESTDNYLEVKLKYKTITDYELNQKLWFCNIYTKILVAKYGYKLEILIKDDSWLVSEEAKRQLKKQNLL